MKNKKIFKKFAGFVLLSSTLFTPLTSCASYFEEEGFVIKDIKWDTNPKTGNTEIVLNTTKEENPEIRIDIPAVGIKDITSSINKEETEIKLTIIYTDTTKSATVVTIPIIKGKDGKGIEKLLVDTNENEDTTLQFVYTDKTKSEVITIKKGKDGVSIKDITADSLTDPDNIILTVTFTDDSEPKVIEIERPNDGISIISTTYNEELSDENNYVITILYSDNYSDDIALPRPKGTTWLHGDKDPDISKGNNGDYYMNVTNGYIYFKENNKWTFIFSMDGTGSYTKNIVTFHQEEGTWLDPQLVNGATFKLVVDYGKYVDLAEFPSIVRENYNFEGWYTTKETNPNGGHFTNLTPVNQNLDLYPRWSTK